MEGNSFGQKVRQWPADFKNYVQELQMEMRRVTWPSRKQVETTTAVVILTVFLFAAYFAVVDSLFAGAIQKLFKVFANQ